MPNNWTALKCEECENPLEPLILEGPRLICLDSEQDVQRLVEAIKESCANHPRPPNSILVLGGEMQIEVVKSPLADLLRCTSCGLLYERRVTSIA
jgi:hypothetical protein